MYAVAFSMSDFGLVFDYREGLGDRANFLDFFHFLMQDFGFSAFSVMKVF